MWEPQKVSPLSSLCTEWQLEGKAVGHHHVTVVTRHLRTFRENTVYTTTGARLLLSRLVCVYVTRVAFKSACLVSNTESPHYYACHGNRLHEKNDLPTYIYLIVKITGWTRTGPTCWESQLVPFMFDRSLPTIFTIPETPDFLERTAWDQFHIKCRSNSNSDLKSYFCLSI